MSRWQRVLRNEHSQKLNSPETVKYTFGNECRLLSISDTFSSDLDFLCCVSRQIFIPLAVENSAQDSVRKDNCDRRDNHTIHSLR